jgi:hypothetical protein
MRRVERPHKITQLQYYAYLLQERVGIFNTLLRAGRLSQEFIVDAYAQVEKGRLDWIRFNQTLLRAECYQGLADAIELGLDLHDIGTRVILPSSFIGGPRQMSELFHDAMAVVRGTSKPDLFITMTCNPNWPEIVNECRKHDQDPQDRPDIVARVFKCKLQALLNDVTKHHVLGRVVAHLHVIEFQKRGLPHAHILLILDPADKPFTSEIIDQIVSAEIPDPTNHPQLYETVISFMLHGPCGLLNTAASCMKRSNGKYCDRRYPREFCNETSLNDDGYPLYRRRDSGIVVEKHGFIFTNKHVVPYNLYLLQKYNCHINVEIATSITSVKYLYKYVYKGHDRTCLAIQLDPDGRPILRDEIKEYVDARYISACEAIWRIHAFSLHAIYPSVTRLQLHLPDMQTVQFDPNDMPLDILNDLNIQHTTLMGFFRLCSIYPHDTINLLYPDCPRYYSWKNHVWIKRQRNTSAIGRVYFVPPTAGEKYYLRILLYNVPGPHSFQHVRTYNNIVYDTFQDACIARGLIETDEEWDICLREASTFKTGHQLRILFVTILLMNEPQDSAGLFERHFQALSDDCRFVLQHQFHIEVPTLNQIRSLALSKLRDLLEKSGRSLGDYKLPLPTIDFDNLNGIPRLIAQQLNYDPVALNDTWTNGHATANASQRQVLDTITHALDSGTGGLFFIDGPGGTGKTFVENLLLAYVRKQGGIALAVASSGIASLLLAGGRTSHSQFKIPIEINSESICSIPAQSQLADLLRSTNLIIWDEAPAQHRYCFEAVDRTLKDIRQSEEWFGGIPVVFGGIYITCQNVLTATGDGRQCLPVIPHATPIQILDAVILNSPFWKDVQIFHLEENMRLLAQARNMTQQEYQLAQNFAEWLLQVGNGSAQIMNDDGTTTLPEGTTFPINTKLIRILSASLSDQYCRRRRRPTYIKYLPTTAPTFTMDRR